MRQSSLNGVGVYDLTSSKTLPEWLSEKKRKALKKDEDFRRHIELLQDFDFPTASSCVALSRDGHHVVVTGTYPPMVKVFDVRELSLKFERHLDAEVVSFVVLSDDFGKLVFLEEDRNVEFHAPYGAHYKTRIPAFGRDMLYHRSSAALYIGGSCSELFVLNLEDGKFSKSLPVTSRGVNSLSQAESVDLIAAGGEGGLVEMVDPRAPCVAATLDVANALGTETDVTCVSFHSAGLILGVGTDHGVASLFDIRSTKPLVVKEHQYGLPVIRMGFHSGSGTPLVVSTDKKIVKMWHRDTGVVFTNIEPGVDINDVLLVREGDSESGLVIVAGEQERVMAFCVPQLGRAPRWCSFLDSITEELEESRGTVYDDYKFVTREELKSLGMEHLVGTSLLRAYMHGFFMDIRLYNRVSAAVDPFAFQRWRKERIRAKLRERAEKRIAPRPRVKVNATLADKLEKQAAEGKATSGGGDGGGVLSDPRFAALFENKDFEIDPESVEYKLRNPTSARTEDAAPESEDEGDDEDEDVAAEIFEEVPDAATGSGGGGGGARPAKVRRTRMFELHDDADVAGDEVTGLLFAAGGRSGGGDSVLRRELMHRRRLKEAPLAERVRKEGRRSRK